jgi:CheY-like chemotaxis protein
MSKILYVEDNDDNFYMLKLRLEKKGYIMTTASNGLEGVDKAKVWRPDIILMDLGLPVMDGYEATKILKSSEDTKNIPIIILTAHALVTDLEKTKEIGADDFETKPVNILNLVAKIEYLLKNDRH